VATRMAVLLRGVNVGKGNRIAMADFRALLAGLGYTDVKTLLNSGNAVFGSPGGSAGEAAARIEKALAAKLELPVRAVVLTAAETARIVEKNPLPGADNPSRLLVAVWSGPGVRAKLAPLEKQDWGDEKLSVGPRAAFLWCPRGVIESRLSAAVYKALGETITSRTWATMKKLATLLDG
jgi:uncharacterized protein (DUF1697 family)